MDWCSWFTLDCGDDGIGNETGEGSLGEVAVVARRSEEADLVLDLHHQDRAITVLLRDATHQGGERSTISVARRVAEGREVVEACTILRQCARESLLVRLDPARRVGRDRVLPRAEPQGHQSQAEVGRGLDHRDDQGGIETALLWLE